MSYDHEIRGYIYRDVIVIYFKGIIDVHIEIVPVKKRDVETATDCVRRYTTSPHNVYPFACRFAQQIFDAGTFKSSFEHEHPTYFFGVERSLDELMSQQCGDAALTSAMQKRNAKRAVLFEKNQCAGWLIPNDNDVILLLPKHTDNVPDEEPS